MNKVGIVFLLGAGIAVLASAYVQPVSRTDFANLESKESAYRQILARRDAIAATPATPQRGAWMWQGDQTNALDGSTFNRGMATNDQQPQAPAPAPQAAAPAVDIEPNIVDDISTKLGLPWRFISRTAMTQLNADAAAYDQQYTVAAAATPPPAGSWMWANRGSNPLDSGAYNQTSAEPAGSTTTYYDNSQTVVQSQQSAQQPTRVVVVSEAYANSQRPYSPPRPRPTPAPRPTPHAM